MPADRLITVNVTGEGMRNQFGVFVPGTTTPLKVWASRWDRSQEDIEQEGGGADSTRRDWRIRWRSDVAEIPVSRLGVVDGAQTFEVINMVEVTRQGRNRADLRRRFLDLQGVYTT